MLTPRCSSLCVLSTFPCHSLFLNTSWNVAPLQALHCLAADPCLPLPPTASPDASVLTAMAAPLQLHRSQQSSLACLTAQQIAPPMHAAAQPYSCPAGNEGNMLTFNPHSSRNAQVGRGRVPDHGEVTNAAGGAHQMPYPPEPSRMNALPQPTPGHPMAASSVRWCRSADLHPRGQPVPPGGANPAQSALPQQQRLVPPRPLPAMSLVQHSRTSMSEQRPERGGPLLARASISTAHQQGVAVGPAGIQLDTRAAVLGSHGAQGLQQRLISPGVNAEELSLRCHEVSRAPPAAAAMSAGQQLDAECASNHRFWLMQSAPNGVQLPNEADSVTPATTAGVLQSGSSEELANALAGLTQMVSTARGMPRRGQQQQGTAVRDAPAASQQTPASQNRAPPSHTQNLYDGVFDSDQRDERWSTRLCTADVEPCMDHPLAGSQAAEPVRGIDQGMTGGAQVEKASLSRPPKRARRAPEAELPHNLPQSTGISLPGGDTPVPAQPPKGLHPCETGRSCASWISQLQQPPAGVSAAPEPTAVAGRPGGPSDGAHAVHAVVSAEGPAAAMLHLGVLEHKSSQLQPLEEHEVAVQPGDVGAGGSAGAASTSKKQLRAILRCCARHTFQHAF